jgi:2-polyprenyl-3-methyl-5-hydroxy-6-metoxy-1,4-benzoquinol methylase
MQDPGVDSLTDATYWDRTWSGRAVPAPLDPRATGLNGTVPRRWHDFFAPTLRTIGLHPGDRVLEAGCGGSVFLPYLAREFALSAEGIDNSPEGCALSNAIAARSGIPATIHFGDVLHPPAALRGRYRAVFSFGLAEHFSPTTSIVSALAAFLRPGGHLITVVPNMHGLVGLLQSVADPSVYRVHVPLSPTELADAHRACGLTIVSARHLMTANFSVINFSGPNSRIPNRVGLRAASWASKLVWSLERIGVPQLPNRWTSPYAVVVARTPDTEGR